MVSKSLQRLYALVALSAALGFAAPTHGADVSEYQLKAELLYRLTRFVYWPDHALTEHDESVNICVLGQDPFGPALDAIVGKTCQGRVVAVQRHINVGPMAEACHVVFISASETARVPDILTRLKDKPILTMGDNQAFIDAGGQIGLATRDGVVSISVNVDAAEQAGLDIGAEILQLAAPAVGTER